MTLNAGEMRVLDALETGLEAARQHLSELQGIYATYLGAEEPIRIRYARRDVIEIEVAIEIVKKWGEDSP